MKVVESKKVRHYYRVLEGKEKSKPGGRVEEITVELRELDEDHPSTMSYELVVIHPEKDRNGALQAPELYRFAREEDACAHFDQWVKTLSSDLGPTGLKSADDAWNLARPNG